jgi:hypothetical protein
MNADQKRTGSASARLQDSHEVISGGLVAAQLGSVVGRDFVSAKPRAR